MPQVQVVKADGARIRELRLERGLTPEQLAAKIAPHRHGQSIRAIERGDKHPSLRLIGDIAKALKVNPAEIIARDPETAKAS